MILLLKLYLIFSAACAAFSALLNPLSGLKLLYIVPLSFLSTLIGLIALHLIIVLAVLLLIDNKKPAGDSSRWYRLLIHLTLDLIIPLLGVKIHATGTELHLREYFLRRRQRHRNSGRPEKVE